MVLVHSLFTLVPKRNISSCRIFSTERYCMAAMTAQALKEKDFSCVIGHTETRLLRSKIVNDDFKLFIAHPVTPLDPEKPPGVIFVLDANTCFGTVVETVRAMGLEGLVPPVYVIGIGYFTQWLIPDAFVKRSRDLSPTKLVPFDLLGHLMLPGLPDEAFETGGGPSFLRFIQEELFPYVMEEFKLDIKESLITGVSLGGLFAAWVLFTEPQTFKRYIISSPSLWWDDEFMLKLWEDSVRNKEDLPARVFMGCGELENAGEFDIMIEKLRTLNPSQAKIYDKDEGILGKCGQIKMAEYFKDFIPQIKNRGFPNLQLESRVFDEESHCSAFAPILTRALRILYK